MEHLGSIYMFFFANGNIRTQKHRARGAQPFRKTDEVGRATIPFVADMLPGDGENEAATFKELMGFLGLILNGREFHRSSQTYQQLEKSSNLFPRQNNDMDPKKSWCFWIGISWLPGIYDLWCQPLVFWGVLRTQILTVTGIYMIYRISKRRWVTCNSPWVYLHKVYLFLAMYTLED